LGAAHPLVAALGGVVFAAEVEETVEDVGEEFVFQAEAFGVALAFGHGGADEQFAVMEGDDVGGRGVAEELGVDAAAGSGAEEGNFEGLEVAGETVREAADGGFSPGLESA
jgi:hypothetical protein